MNNKNILIVNYGFPPNPGVGGRRWAMFAHHLSQHEGYTVHVLLKKNDTQSTSLYNNLTADQTNIHLHYIPTFYPSVLETKPTHLFAKILYRIWLLILGLYSKGTPYDRTIFFKKRIQKKGLKIIRDYNINNVIVTGAPFRLCYYFALIKVNIPNFIVDFRDPWTWSEGGYGYNNLSEKKTKFEKKMEAYVIKHADTVFSPVEIMNKELSNLYPNSIEKFKVLTHGFDAENIPVRKAPLLENKKTIKLIFIGTLYDGIGNLFSEIARAISDENTDITIDFFSSSTKYFDLFKLNKTSKMKVIYHSPVAPKKLFELIKNYDFCLLVNPPHVKNYISTKFYELIYSKTPILYVGQQGFVSDFIMETKIGVYINSADVYNRFLNARFASNFTYAPDIDITPFSYSQLTKTLIKFFK